MAKEIKLARMYQGQVNIYHALGRRSVLRCGRRWGKSTMFETMAGNWAVRNSWYVGIFAPDYKKMRPIFSNLLFNLKPVITQSSKVERIIELRSGGRIEFFSLTDEDAGRSRKFHRVLIDEAQSTKDSTMKDQWEKSIEPTLLDYSGRCIVAGTPKGINPENWFWQINHNQNVSEQWRVFHAPSASNPHLPPEELALKKSTVHPLVFRQEYLAEFVDFTGTAFFDLQNLTNNGAGVPFPQHCDYIGCAIDTAIKDGVQHDGTAVVYFARNKIAGTPLIVLDWDVVQVKGNVLTQWLPGVLARCDELAAFCGARYGSAGAWVEDKASGSVLLQEAEDRGWMVNAIPPKYTSMGKNDRAIACSSPVYSNQVRLTQHAIDKTAVYKEVQANHLISQFCGFVINDPKAYKRADDLADAMMYSILVTLEPEI
ncbi:hypothetical protein VSR68_03365 [Paraburkholderia phymatum]|uniref:hypothetical protein n=1 Tax=Paraburkholderia phymatum TaxID=148447 RepID=UPI00317D2EE2